MIEVTNLTKVYQNIKAVDGLSFKLDKGETLALVGTSGSGKTTTLRMINRLIEPTSGEIKIDGINIIQQPLAEVRRKMGYVIQDIGLFPHYTIEENIAIVPNLLGWEKEKIQRVVYQLMEQLKLPPGTYARQYPHELSGGQQQRVGVARALAGDPPIILMDEPFGALDPITRQDIRKDFLELEELAQKTTIIVTHDTQEAFELSNYICVLDKGKIQQLGSPKELLLQPANEFVQNFLKGQLLELEFQIITLDDLFDELPESIGSYAVQSPLSFQLETSVLEVLSNLMKRPSDKGIGVAEKEGETKYFDIATLMNYFHQALNPSQA